MSGIRGLVSRVQRFSLHDGPGVRTTVFLQGCPLCCAWCHNPETLPDEPGVLLDARRCLHCGACVEACPLGHPVGSAQGVDPAECLHCGACADACPSGARTLAARETTVAELLGELLADRPFFDRSGGGVTFSGGEPLRQGEFLLAVLTACRREGLHTAVDTAGLAPRALLLEVAAATDLFLYDVKHALDEPHRRWTGVSNRPILANLRALAAVHETIWIRIPLVGGVNDDDRNLEATLELLSPLRAVRRVTLLPYHRLGDAKAGRIPGQGERRRFEPPTPERLGCWRRRLGEEGWTSEADDAARPA